MIDKKELGRRLKALRILEGKTQKEMALLVGITHQQWAKYEAGVDTIGAEPLTKMCKEFRLSADVILGLAKRSGEPVPDLDAG